jgi:glycerol-3-phosphate dehydrogenase (NAD(P)+)
MTILGILGGGAWGTALGRCWALAGHPVRLWLRDVDLARTIMHRGENPRYLPGLALGENVTASADLDSLAQVDVLVVAVPTQSLRTTLTLLKEALPDVPVILCAKGIEQGSGVFPVDIARSVLPHHKIALLSGPSFASDVARFLPTAVTLASEEGSLANDLAHTLSTPTLRMYYSHDVLGVSIGGALKNVLAIACGLVSGRGLGESARAALLARGFAEMQRFAAHTGARPETLMGLSGLGDVVLTASSLQSRNFAFGHALGRGLSVEEAHRGLLVEGLMTARALVSLAQDAGLDLPVAEAIHAISHGSITIDEALNRLMGRPLRAES